jgi:hypothetical protein
LPPLTELVQPAESFGAAGFPGLPLRHRHANQRVDVVPYRRGRSSDVRHDPAGGRRRVSQCNQGQFSVVQRLGTVGPLAPVCSHWPLHACHFQRVVLKFGDDAVRKLLAHSGYALDSGGIATADRRSEILSGEAAQGCQGDLGAHAGDAGERSKHLAVELRGKAVEHMGVFTNVEDGEESDARVRWRQRNARRQGHEHLIPDTATLDHDTREALQNESSLKEIDHRRGLPSSWRCRTRAVGHRDEEILPAAPDGVGQDLTPAYAEAVDRPATKLQNLHSSAAGGGASCIRHSRAAMIWGSTQSSDPVYGITVIRNRRV